MDVLQVAVIDELRAALRADTEVKGAPRDERRRVRERRKIDVRLSVELGHDEYGRRPAITAPADPAATGNAAPCWWCPCRFQCGTARASRRWPTALCLSSPRRDRRCGRPPISCRTRADRERAARPTSRPCGPAALPNRCRC